MEPVRVGVLGMGQQGTSHGMALKRMEGTGSPPSPISWRQARSRYQWWTHAGTPGILPSHDEGYGCGLRIGLHEEGRGAIRFDWALNVVG